MYDASWYINALLVYECFRYCRCSLFRHSISAGGAARLSSIAAAYCRTLCTPLLVRHTCKQSRVIRVLSGKSRNTTILGKIAFSIIFSENSSLYYTKTALFILPTNYSK